MPIRPIFSLFLVSLIISCKSEPEKVIVPTPVEKEEPKTEEPASGFLKDKTDIPIGVAIDYGEFRNYGETLINIVKTEFDNVTFGYNMKHGSIVKGNGTLDFEESDKLMEMAGLPVFGHVLAWHENNNGDYLRSLSYLTEENSGDGINLIPNGSFEEGDETSNTNWATLVLGDAIGSFEIETDDVSEGVRALKAIVTTAGTNAWDMQLLGPAFEGKVDSLYKVTASIKSLNGDGGLKLILQNNEYRESQINIESSEWETYEWKLTLAETNPEIKIHFNQSGIYLIDNIKVEKQDGRISLEEKEAIEKVDVALKSWIQGVIDHYPTVKSWDAVNEVYTDGSPMLRTGRSEGSTYYWSDMLGRGYIAKTFQYAKEACPDCEFFLNDYNLEFNEAKLDSNINLAEQLLAQGVPIDGLGTQMHTNINISNDAIDNMFIKMANTGLKVRVSELDIRVNPNNTPGFVLTDALLQQQAEKYNYVVKSYIENVPPNQQHGITIWGVSDANSWINTYLGGNDFPLLWDTNFEKKAAYTGFSDGLK